jgi:uncharacterized protein YkwD
VKSLILITIAVICYSTNIFPQGIYDSIDIKNFRNYKAFNEQIDIKNFNSELLNAAVFFVTNEIRKKNKLPFLKYNSALEAAANMHSTDMAKDDFFSHTNTKNKKHKEPEDRATLAGIQNPHIAENITEGFILQYNSNESVITGESGIFYKDENYIPIPSRTYLELADDLLKIWMNSKAHRENILAADALELGCGSAFYVMKDFNNMPCVKATQNFQWFIPVIIK